MSEVEQTQAAPADAKALRRVSKREVQELARYLVEDPIYLLELQNRMREGTLHPMLQQMLWHYAKGKPPDRIEIQDSRTIKIIHQIIGEDAPDVIEGEVRREGHRHALEPPTESGAADDN